ncbi:MAG: DUF2207 domain-containing protein [Alphaproteobacteria bacterium]|nr:DUF2207 domain-containing protein [Alphaproteobacteria bacterium]
MNVNKILFLLLFISPLLCGFSARAENFVIKNYDIELLVNRDQVVTVRENITADFQIASHGIFRDIPNKNSDISSIYVDNRYSVEHSVGNVRLKIGSPDTLVTGLQNYGISFKHQLFGDRREFYYNIVGTGWPVTIEKVRFKVILPAPFDKSKVGLSIGEYGTAGFKDGARFTMFEKEIIGETFAPLPPYHGITLRMEFPQGYFNQKENPWIPITLWAIIIMSLLSFSIWFLYGKDAHITPVVSFYPPKDFNVYEAEQVCTEKITSKSLVAMLIALAHQGFINIVTDDKDFSLIRLKEYDGNNAAMKKLMEALFKRGSHQLPTVGKNDLEKSTTFYKDCDSILKSLNGYKSKFFSAVSVNKAVDCFMFLLSVGLVLLTAFALNHYRFGDDMAGLLLSGLICGCFLTVFRRNTKSLIGPAIFAVFVFYLFLQQVANSMDSTNSWQVQCGFVGAIISIICYIQMPQLNFTGRRSKGELLGLKKFIDVAEKKRLELLVEENPEYFYDILPYAYILGVSDKWIKQFESITDLNPDWYKGNFKNLNRFSKSMNLMTQPSVANGGISQTSSRGGGGFSGGGFGGGGGGSW